MEGEVSSPDLIISQLTELLYEGFGPALLPFPTPWAWYLILYYSNTKPDRQIGHAGAIVQARQLGNELYVGVHSDEAILENKGPTVMTLQER